MTAGAPADENETHAAAAIAARLRDLFHHRWSAPVLAELHGQRGSKFITLVNRLAASRDSIRAAIQSLIEQGLVIRNPGYGHPLRPEYVLAETAGEAARQCASLMRTISSMELKAVALRKWSMPALFALSRGGARFTSLKSTLADITARALTLALKDLCEAGLAERRVHEGYPPSTSYRITPRGRRLVRLLPFTE